MAHTIPPSSDPYQRISAALRANASNIVEGVGGVTIVAVLAAAAAHALVTDTSGALAGLGGNALATWLLTSWLQWLQPAKTNTTESSLDNLAQSIQKEIDTNPQIAADVAELLQRTDAIACVLGGLRDQAEVQVDWLYRFFNELNSHRLQNEQLHNATLQALFVQSNTILDAIYTKDATLAQQLADEVRRNNIDLAKKLEDILIQIRRKSGDQVHGDKIDGDKVLGDKNVFLAVTDTLPIINLDKAKAHLATMPTDNIPEIAAPPSGSRMKLSNNSFFVGRDNDLKNLARELKNQNSSIVLTGMGGMGKTSLAVEFVHRYGQYFLGGVFWLSFADSADIESEIVDCGGAGAMRLPVFDSIKPLSAQVKRVLSEWNQGIPRLLIFDNCEDRELFNHYHSLVSGCCILITSKNATWLPQQDVIMHPLQILTRVDSCALLHKFLPKLSLHDPSLDSLAAELGNLPLALHVAGSYLQLYFDDIGGIEGYLTKLRNQPIDTLTEQLEEFIDAPTRHDLNVRRTFAISYDELHIDTPKNKLAQKLLIFAACFAPGESIPEALLKHTLEYKDTSKARIAQTDAIRRLIALGLLERDDRDENVILRLHRLMHAYVRSVAKGELLETSTEMVKQVFYERLHQANEQEKIDEQLPAIHIRYVVDQALQQQDSINRKLTCDLAFEYNRYLYTLSSYKEALPYAQKALEGYRQILAENDWRIAKVLNSHALLYDYLGDYAAARAYYINAIDLLDAINLQENEPPDLLPTIYDNACAFLTTYEEYTEARIYGLYGLKLREERPIQKRFQIGINYHNLGVIDHNEGKLDDALRNYNEALAIYNEEALPISRYRAMTLQNIGEIYYSHEQYDKARKYFDAARKIYEHAQGAWGFNHTYNLFHLANCCYQQREYLLACDYITKCVQLRETLFGSDNDDTKEAQKLFDKWSCSSNTADS